MARGARRFGSMKEFANHRTGGSGGKFLSKWKEKGHIETWMHTKVLPMAVWRHQIPQVVIVEDKKDRGNKITHIYSKQLVCHEAETVLGSQYFREQETGLRKTPPQRCGICKLVEWAYQQCLLFEETRKKKTQKGLNFTTPMFLFEGDIADERALLHVGGICGLLNKEHNDAQKEDMKTAKLSPRNAWKENAYSKCQYAMMVVDNNDPEAGIQIAVEASSLGDKVKKVLNDELENDIDIQKSPYCIKWKYDDKESDINKKYGAVALRKLVPTTRVLKLIRGEVPDLPDNLTDPFNQQSVRAILERHCLLPKGIVPWDELFPSKEQSAVWAKEDAEEEAAADEEESSEDEEEDEDEDEEEFECDNEDCKKPVKASDKKCPHCGQVFEVEDGVDDDEEDEDEDDDEEDEEEEEEAPKSAPKKKKMRSRSEARREKEQVKVKTESKAKPKADDDSTTDDDDIPF